MRTLKALRHALVACVSAGALLTASGASAQTAVPPVTDPGPPVPAPPTGESTLSAGAAQRPGGGEGTRDAGLSRGGPSREGGSATPSGPPKYKNLRYDEDYSHLKDPSQRTDPWDALKYIAIFGRDDWFLTLGGETRQRFEAVRNDDLGRLPYTDGYYLQRYMLHADLHLGDRVRLFAQVQSGFIDGRQAGPRPDIDRDVWDAHQAFADLTWSLGTGEDDKITWRLGRQEMAYGSGRLIDTREGPNLRRSFDGARFLAKTGEWAVDGWWSKPVRNRPNVFDNDPDPASQFWGTYAVRPIGDGTKANVDLYYLGYENRDARYAQGEGREVRHSVGTRVWGMPLPWEYNLEYVYQFGRFGVGRISAWTAAHAVRYNLSELPLKPRPGLRFDIASGDRDASSQTLNTFNPLFPSGVYFNLANPVGPSNLIDLHPTLDLFLSDKVTLSADWNFFWRQSIADGVYRLSGSLLRPVGGSDARYVGQSPSITLTWTPTRHVSFLVSYVHFLPGSFLRDNPPADPLNFVTAWVTYKF